MSGSLSESCLPAAHHPDETGQRHTLRQLSSPANVWRCLFLLVFYLLLAVPSLGEIWGGTGLALDRPAQIALSIVLLCATCPLSASVLSALLLVLWKFSSPSVSGRMAVAKPWSSPLNAAGVCIKMAATILSLFLLLIQFQ